MGLADLFGSEQTVDIKISQLCEILKDGVKEELIENAIKCDVPHKYIREMISGESNDKFHGKFIEGGCAMYICSICGFEYAHSGMSNEGLNFCPECGARMREEVENNG